MKNEHFNFILLIISSFIANVGIGMAWPYLPIYISILGGVILDITLLSILYNLLGSVSQYPWGKWSDATGIKKWFISFGNISYGFFMMLMSLTTSVSLILIYRSFQGLFSSMSTPTTSALIVELAGDKIGTYFGFYNSISELGYSIGNILGSYVVSFLGGPKSTIFFGSLIVLFSSLPVLIIKERRLKIERHKIPFPTLRPEGKPGRFPIHLKDALNIFKTNRDIFHIVIASIFVMTASGIVYSILPIYFSYKFGEHYVGIFYGVEALSVVIFTPIFGYFADRKNIKYILLFGISGYILTYILYYLSFSNLMVIISEIISGMKWSAFIISASTYVSILSPPGKQARSQALFNISQTIGYVFGPVLTVLVYSYYGNFLSVFTLGIIFAIIGLVYSYLKTKSITRAKNNYSKQA
ncbi:MAG: MFS transporter [Thermoplasmata archaeon]